MMSYADQYKLIESQEFRARVQVALWRAAGESRKSAKGLPDAAAQIAWAATSLRGVLPQDEMRPIIIELVARGVGMASTDEQIQTAIDAMAPDLATAK